MPVRLSKMTSNRAALTQGEWVPLSGEYEGIRVKTRKLTDAYQDAIASKVRRAARGGAISDIKTETLRRIRHECLTEHVWIDVDGVTDDNDQAISGATFFASLIEPGYEELFEACAATAVRVTAMQAEDAKEAAGN